MLTPEQKGALAEVVESLNTAYPTHPSDILDALTPLIDRWLTEALALGPLPDGWERSEQWRYSLPWSHDSAPQDRREWAEICKPRDAVIQRREVITGPWSPQACTVEK